MTAVKVPKRREAELAQLLWHCRSYGDLERLAGVADRNEFWADHSTEVSARQELHARIRQRFVAGEIK